MTQCMHTCRRTAWRGQRAGGGNRAASDIKTHWALVSTRAPTRPRTRQSPFCDTAWPEQASATSQLCHQRLCRECEAGPTEASKTQSWGRKRQSCNNVEVHATSGMTCQLQAWRPKNKFLGSWHAPECQKREPSFSHDVSFQNVSSMLFDTPGALKNY